jgi:S1-C subfamily serine protease
MRRQPRNPKYIATLALVSASILISGSLLKPAKKPREQPLSETEMTRLQRLAQRQSLDNMADFFVQVAADVQSSVVRLPRAGRSGVIWEPDVVVTANTEQRFGDSESFWAPNGRAVSAETTVAAPALPIAAVQAREETVLSIATRLPVEFLRSGRWVLAVWRRANQEHAFAPGTFLGTQEVHCWENSFQEVVSTLALNEVMAGGGLFDLDGNLLGLVTLCDGRPIVISGESVQSALDYGASFDGRMATRYGMGVANLGEKEQTYYKRKDGALIKETWRGYRGDQAGLLPGDVIVDLEGKPVRSVDDLEVLVLPLALEIFEVRILRGPKAMQLSLRARPPSSAPPVDETHSGLQLSSPPTGYAIDSVMPGSPAAQAGIEPGDRLLKIGHEDPRNLAAVQQALSQHRANPLHVVLERGDRRWEVILE